MPEQDTKVGVGSYGHPVLFRDLDADVRRRLELWEPTVKALQLATSHAFRGDANRRALFTALCDAAPGGVVL